MTHQPGSAPRNPDPHDGAVWRKASASDANSGCVEAASLPSGLVGVRDSRDRSGPAIAVSASAWGSFIADARSGCFDLPS